jgi:hypothetical protein
LKKLPALYAIAQSGIEKKRTIIKRSKEARAGFDAIDEFARQGRLKRQGSQDFTIVAQAQALLSTRRLAS